jgi:hypothetical protein
MRGSASPPWPKIFGSKNQRQKILLLHSSIQEESFIRNVLQKNDLKCSVLHPYHRPTVAKDLMDWVKHSQNNNNWFFMNDNAHAFALIFWRLLPQKWVTETNHSPHPHSPGLTYKHSSKMKLKRK